MLSRDVVLVNGENHFRIDSRLLYDDDDDFDPVIDVSSLKLSNIEISDFSSYISSCANHLDLPLSYFKLAKYLKSNIAVERALSRFLRSQYPIFSKIPLLMFLNKENQPLFDQASCSKYIFQAHSEFNMQNCVQSCSKRSLKKLLVVIRLLDDSCLVYHPVCNYISVSHRCDKDEYGYIYEDSSYYRDCSTITYVSFDGSVKSLTAPGPYSDFQILEDESSHQVFQSVGINVWNSFIVKPDLTIELKSSFDPNFFSLFTDFDSSGANSLVHLCSDADNPRVAAVEVYQSS
ncbi:hypothetical protein GEMRC1_006546 [Eukaryota sp. GEM-RC1]